MSATSLLLPSVRAGEGWKKSTIARAWKMANACAAQGAGQGWKIATRVGPSHVLGAGNGRFALENVSTHAPLVVKPYVHMSRIETLSTVPGDHTITFHNTEDVEKYIRLCEQEGGHSRERILQKLSKFVWGYDGKRACLNQSSCLVANHASDFDQGLNVAITERRLDDGRLAIVGDAVADIWNEDELYMDYRRFVLPEFYLAFCEENNIKDVRTLVMEAIGE